MTKSELVETVARREGIPRATAERLVNTFFDSIREALVAGQRVEVRGFGTFHARAYEGYTGRNPRTGASITVAPKVLPVFKVGKELRTRVNGGAAEGSA